MLKNIKKKCLYEPTICRDCKEKVPRKDIEVHLDSKCPKRLTECNVCHEQIPTRTLPSHQSDSKTKCINAMQCPNHCDIKVILKKKS